MWSKGHARPGAGMPRSRFSRDIFAVQMNFGQAYGDCGGNQAFISPAIDQ
jgi:hypothetical protein